MSGIGHAVIDASKLAPLEIEKAQITPTALQGGFKADAGKARLDLVPPMLLKELMNYAIDDSEHDETMKGLLHGVNEGICDFWDGTSKARLWDAITQANNVLRRAENVTAADTVLKLGELYEIGAKKYAARNWEKGMDWGRCFSAMSRHLLKFIKGEKYDLVDGQHHLSSVVWNAVALLHFSANLEKYSQFDSRNKIEVSADKGQN
jgi:hypothetical protein